MSGGEADKLKHSLDSGRVHHLVGKRCLSVKF